MIPICDDQESNRASARPGYAGRRPAGGVPLLPGRGQAQRRAAALPIGQVHAGLMGTTGPREAAVVLGFHRNANGHLTLVVIERTACGRHGGQISLPGGNLEPTDASAEAAAIRETCEEIGTSPAQVRIIEALDPLQTRTTRYRVWPFVARFTVDPDHRWTPQHDEATAVIELPVNRLADDSAIGQQEFTFPGWDAPRTMPTRTVDGHVVWGLTLRVIESHLKDALRGRWRL
jgi:8-oxo-dGTP pyrophosphatase MutT (NUDIX family)